PRGVGVSGAPGAIGERSTTRPPRTSSRRIDLTWITIRVSSARMRTLPGRTHPVAPFGRSGSSTRYHDGRHAWVRRIAVTAKTVGTWFTFRRPNRRTAGPPGLLKTTAWERTRATSERPPAVVATIAPASQRGGAGFAAGGGGARVGSA